MVAASVSVRLASMGDSGEAVLARFPATARLSVGLEHLEIFFTSGRIIVAHHGKRGAATMAATLLGRLSGAFEDLVKSGKESVKRRKSDPVNPIDILAMDKDNFAIGYDEVISISLVTRDGKFLLSTTLALEKLVEILGRDLSDRLTVRMPR